MATITSLGVGSGIDAESIVTKLMSLERRPLSQIATKESAVNAKISAFGTLKNLLATLRTAADTLGTPNKLAAFTGTSSNESALTATATGTAAAGTYSISVQQLAQAHKLTHATAIAGDSTGIINSSGSDKTFSITIDGDTTNITVGNNATLGDLRNLINNSSAGVTANIVTNVSGGSSQSRLILTAKETGLPVTTSTTLSGFGSFHTVGGEQGKNAIIGTTLFSSSTEIVGSGTFNITSGTTNTPVTIPANTTLASLPGLINAAGAGVTASIVGNATDGYRLKMVADSSTYSVSSNTEFASTYTFGEGTMSLTVGGTAVPVNLSGNYNLAQVRDQINAQAGSLVTASIVAGTTGDTLKIEALNPGKPVSYTFTDGASGVSDGPLSGLNAQTTSSTASTTSQAISYTVQDTSSGDGYDFTRLSGYSSFGTPLQNAQSAKLTIEGMAIESTSNNISTSISGVTLNLKGTGDSTLTVERNQETVKTAVDAFVSAFNALNTQIRSYTAYDSANKKANTLTGDTTTRNMQSQITGILNSTPGTPSGSFSRLADLGITIGTSGNLSVDSAKLQSAIETDFNSVSDVLDRYGSELYTKIGNFTATDGMISSKTDSLSAMIKEYSRQKDTLELRLTAIEKRYRAQFSSLDTLIGSMQTTSSFLSQQIAKF